MVAEAICGRISEPRRAGAWQARPGTSTGRPSPRARSFQVSVTCWTSPASTWTMPGRFRRTARHDRTRPVHRPVLGPVHHALTILTGTHLPPAHGPDHPRGLIRPRAARAGSIPACAGEQPGTRSFVNCEAAPCPRARGAALVIWEVSMSNGEFAYSWRSRQSVFPRPRVPAGGVLAEPIRHERGRGPGGPGFGGGRARASGPGLGAAPFLRREIVRRATAIPPPLFEVRRAVQPRVVPSGSPTRVLAHRLLGRRGRSPARGLTQPVRGGSRSSGRPGSAGRRPPRSALGSG